MLKEMKMLYVNEQIYEFHEASEDSTVFLKDTMRQNGIMRQLTNSGFRTLSQ